MPIFVGALLLIILPLVVSCKRDDNPGEKENQTQTPEPPVEVEASSWYAAGMNYDLESDCIAATVWKDGQVLYAISEPETFSVALGICVDGEDVYSCGMLENGVGDYNVIWKNGKQILSIDMDSEQLSGNVIDGFTDVAVVGGDVYALASLYVSTGGGYRTTPVLFKNGTPSLFDTKSNNAEVNSIDGVGNDLYATGSVDVNGMVMPAMWENGKVTILKTPEETVEGAAYSVSVIGKDVYVMGEVYSLTSDIALPCIWKNGEPTQLLSDTQFDAYATDVSVKSGDTYVSGVMSDSDEEFAILWQGGDYSMLGTGAAVGVVNCKDDIIVGGYTYLGDDYDNPPMATIWVNGNPQYLGYGSIIRMCSR